MAWLTSSTRPTESVASGDQSRSGGAHGLEPVLAVAAAHLPANGIHGPAMGLDTEEGSQRAALGIETIRVGPQSHQYLLHHILGRAAIAGHPPGQPEQERGMAVEDFGQCLLVACCEARHERAIPWIHRTERSALFFRDLQRVPQARPRRGLLRARHGGHIAHSPWLASLDHSTTLGTAGKHDLQAILAANAWAIS